MKLNKFNLIAWFAVITILTITSCKDDEEPTGNVSLIIESVSQLEGDEGVTIFAFNLKANSEVTETVTVDYETREDVALEGEDFENQAGSASIPPGSREVAINIEVKGDVIIESNETFKLVISNPVNAVITSSTATGTIQNDDFFTPGDDEGYTTPDSYPGYTLVWQDEFDGTGLNTDDWNYETGTVDEFGNNGWGNNELQNYQDGTSNAYLSNGKLVIEAREENANGSNYTSARITTKNKQNFQYGRIDIRAKLPQGQGLWPALWMLGESYSSIGWPFCGEIDIMEIVGHEPATVHGTIHWDNQGSYASYGQNTTLSSGTFADEYHVFTIIWDAQEIRWLLDDVQYNIVDITPDGLSEFKEPFYFIFNVAVGGNWPGAPDASTTFPQRMEVDYVRVFQ